MLKLVEIINTLPHSVCRVVLYAESKDDRSQAALEEFQSKAGFTVAGGSFIYDCDKEIIVTATDGQLGPEDDSQTDLHYWLTHDEFTSAGSKVVNLEALADGSLTEEEMLLALNNLFKAAFGYSVGIITIEQVVEKFNNGEYGYWDWNEETQSEFWHPYTESDEITLSGLGTDRRYTTAEVTESEDGPLIALRDYGFGQHGDGFVILSYESGLTWGDLVNPQESLPKYFGQIGKGK